MQTRKLVKAVLLFSLLTLNLFAIEGKVRVFIPSKVAIYISEKITVSVELLSDAFSITNAKIIFPESQKYIVQSPQSASYLGREEIDDQDWQMVHYDYEIYALKPGRIEIPSVLVSFKASMGYGQPTKEFEIKSEALSFNVKVPEGVKDDQFVLVTDNFRLTSDIRPKSKKLIVGDAVEMRIIQEAYGVPDLLLKPIVYSSNEFLRVYQKEPLLQNALKGAYDVSRTDQFTFVASIEGNVTLPSQEILWFDKVNQKIHVEKTPSIKYEILPDPQIEIDAKKAGRLQFFVYLGFVLLCSIAFFLFFMPKIRHLLNERKRRYEISEAGLFDSLLTSIQTADARTIDRSFNLWILSVSPNLMRGGVRSFEKMQPSFSVKLKEFQLWIIDPEKKFDRVKFGSELKIFRETLLQEKKYTDQGLPKSINPS